jgi:hypothetical protein
MNTKHQPEATIDTLSACLKEIAAQADFNMSETEYPTVELVMRIRHELEVKLERVIDDYRDLDAELEAMQDWLANQPPEPRDEAARKFHDLRRIRSE